MTLPQRSSVPWYLWCAALAVTSAYVGGYWDISWHRSIGRDTFWTAPHIAIYACGVLAGISSAYLILTTTFQKSSPLRDVSVRIWGFTGPLGAFLLAWGGMAMLVSAPFDDWWHNAYGLDVKIVSPPHMVLAAGFFGIELGAVMLLLAFMNRAADGTRRALQRLFLYVGGTVVCESLLLKLEYIDRSDMHSGLFYIVVMLGTAAMIPALALASRHPWGCTIVSGVYTAFGLALLWILPLVPAEPKLGPVYQQVTHLIPWEFPLLLVVPAFAVDLALRRTDSWRPIARALVIGLGFLGIFVAVQWPFADFLLSPHARNYFFGAGYLGYNTQPTSPYARFVFAQGDVQIWRGMLVAAVMSCLMAWLGLWAGRAMQRVRR
jgi:hypothetical protein